MKFIICFLISFILYSCTSSLDTKEFTQSPCNDITYQSLKKKNFGEMTSSELEYFKMKDKECEEFIADQRKSIYNDRQADKNTIWWVLGGIAAVIVLGLVFLSGFGNWH